ncbi:hypothetical protein E3V33_04820 [Candidatus Marinimicrobia bacterium MT.SAG.4]|nr:hypothetical protein E3V33_04820 [Candidatus Marinimicrobia bacterium MT.SAG.4]
MNSEWTKNREWLSHFDKYSTSHTFNNSNNQQAFTIDVSVYTDEQTDQTSVIPFVVLKITNEDTRTVKRILLECALKDENGISYQTQTSEIDFSESGFLPHNGHQFYQIDFHSTKESHRDATLIIKKVIYTQSLGNKFVSNRNTEGLSKKTNDPSKPLEGEKYENSFPSEANTNKLYSTLEIITTILFLMLIILLLGIGAEFRWANRFMDSYGGWKFLIGITILLFLMILADRKNLSDSLGEFFGQMGNWIALFLFIGFLLILFKFVSC